MVLQAIALAILRALPWIITVGYIVYEVVSQFMSQPSQPTPQPTQPSSQPPPIDVSQVVQLITGILPLFLILSLLRVFTKSS